MRRTMAGAETTLLRPGDIVDRYEIEHVLGEGGMATVYRVRHRTLGTRHALKVLHTRQGSVKSRLVDEGKVQAHLDHPNVVAVTDVLDVLDAPALLMQFVPGGSLAELLDGGPLPPDEALRIFRATVAGVAHAHAAGLVHRDLKPANVLLAINPKDPSHPTTPKVTDFGLAKHLGQSGGGRTRSTTAMGTPAYMAPEQVRDAAKVDARADVWSLGVILYELVCGRRAFPGNDPVNLMFAVVAGRFEPIAPDSLDPAVRAAIQGCLTVDRDARIPDCATLLRVLDGAQPWTAPPLPTKTPAVPHLRAFSQSASATFASETPPTPNPTQETLDPSAWPSPPPTPGVATGSPTFNPDAFAAAPTRLPSEPRLAPPPTPPTAVSPAPVTPASMTMAPPPDDPPPQQASAPAPTTAHTPATHAPAPAPTRRAAPRLATALLLVIAAALAAALDVSARLDIYLQHPVIAAVNGRLALDDVAVLGVNVPDVKALRATHPATIDALVDAGVRVIVMDIALSSASDQDSAIADAVTRAHAAGVPVILPARIMWDAAVVPSEDQLSQAATLGIVEFQADRGTNAVRRAAVRARDQDGVTWWHVAVLAANTLLGSPDPPHLADTSLVLGAVRIETSNEFIEIPPFADPLVVPYHDTGAFPTLRGRAVVIGAFGGTGANADIHNTPDGPRYGPELQAALIQSLVRNAGLRRAHPAVDALATIIAGWGAVGLGLVLRRKQRIFVWLAPLAVVAVGLALATAGTLVALLPPLIAGLFAHLALPPLAPEAPR